MTRENLGQTGQLRSLTNRVAYVLPVSDDGGSTAEIVRVVGGPAVGDIRSRCLRLADDSDDEVGSPRLAPNPSSLPCTHLPAISTVTPAWITSYLVNPSFP